MLCATGETPVGHRGIESLCRLCKSTIGIHRDLNSLQLKWQLYA